MVLYTLPLRRSTVMVGLFSCLVVGLLILSPPAPHKADILVRAKEGQEAINNIIQECNPRKGWEIFFSKLDSRPIPMTLKIAFLGGSITRKNDCWRPQTMDMFRRLYPHITWEEVNASVGGTGSDFGAFRLGRDVIVHKPDLIFIEFAVNDHYVSQSQTQKTMEGIVRQVRRDTPEASVAFVYAIREDFVSQYDLTNATVPRSVAASEVVAEHYGVPTIHLGLEIVKLGKLSRVNWSAGVWGSKEEVVETGNEFWFGSDGVHPHALTGCLEYTKAIERCIPGIHGQSMVPVAMISTAQPSLPEPLDPLNYEKVAWLSPDRAQLAKRIEKIDSRDLIPIEDLGDAYRAQRPGDTFTLHFVGSYVGIYGIVGPFSGTILLTLDGGTPKLYPLFSTFNYKNRPSFFPLLCGLPIGPHTLVLDVSPNVPDKVSILAPKNRTISLEAQARTDCVLLAFCVL